MTVKQYGAMLHKARTLTRQFGVRAAAGYLRNRKVPFCIAWMALRVVLPRV